VVQSEQPRSNYADTAAPTLPRRSPLEGIADLLDNLPTEAYLELTRRLLTVASTVPLGESCSKPVPETIIFFIAENDNAA
jgi:hypothetical protein